jgi:hypothetical protein
MRKHFAVIVLFLAPTLACSMWSKPASGWTGATAGEQVEKLFWQDVQAKNWAEVDRHIAATFVGTGPGGSMDRAAFLRDLQRAPISGVSLSECASQLNGADLIVTCTLRAQSAGQPYSGATLSVWQQLKKGWVMVAHAESQLAPASP